MSTKVFAIGRFNPPTNIITSSGYYVYAYLDPWSKIPFYVGKGSSYRWKRHLMETKDNTENYKKMGYH